MGKMSEFLSAAAVTVRLQKDFTNVAYGLKMIYNQLCFALKSHKTKQYVGKVKKQTNKQTHGGNLRVKALFCHSR